MDSWPEKVAGLNCPFDGDRHRCSESLYRVGKLKISTLYLDINQTYRGHCVLIFDPRHVTRIDELSSLEWSLLATDIRQTQVALMKTVKPDHINVASLGQVVPHLHWHIIPRYLNDPRWGGAIWTSTPEEMTDVRLEIQEYKALVETIALNLYTGESDES